MAVSVTCESCGRRFEVADELAGQALKCSCGQVVEPPRTGSIMDFFSQELDLRDSHMLAETPAEWAKATGAPPEVLGQIEKRMAKKRTSNPAFMMAIVGAIIAVLLIAGLLAFLMAARNEPAATSAVPSHTGVVRVGCVEAHALLRAS